MVRINITKSLYGGNYYFKSSAYQLNLQKLVDDFKYF